MCKKNNFRKLHNYPSLHKPKTCSRPFKSRRNEQLSFIDESASRASLPSSIRLRPAGCITAAAKIRSEKQPSPESKAFTAMREILMGTRKHKMIFPADRPPLHNQHICVIGVRQLNTPNWHNIYPQ
jgi:hypothetical protein